MTSKFTRRGYRVQPTPAVCISRKPGEQPPPTTTGRIWQLEAFLTQTMGPSNYAGFSTASSIPGADRVVMEPLAGDTLADSRWSAYVGIGASAPYVEIVRNQGGADEVSYESQSMPERTESSYDSGVILVTGSQFGSGGWVRLTIV